MAGNSPPATLDAVLKQQMLADGDHWVCACNAHRQRLGERLHTAVDLVGAKSISAQPDPSACVACMRVCMLASTAGWQAAVEGALAQQLDSAMDTLREEVHGHDQDISALRAALTAVQKTKTGLPETRELETLSQAWSDTVELTRLAGPDTASPGGPSKLHVRCKCPISQRTSVEVRQTFVNYVSPQPWCNASYSLLPTPTPAHANCRQPASFVHAVFFLCCQLQPHCRLRV